jgi:hypothetical protein
VEIDTGDRGGSTSGGGRLSSCKREAKFDGRLSSCKREAKFDHRDTDIELIEGCKWVDTAG